MHARHWLLGAGAAMALLTAVPAHADWRDGGRREWREHEWREHQWREHEWRERHEWRPAYRYGYGSPPPVFYPAPRYYWYR